MGLEICCLTFQNLHLFQRAYRYWCLIKSSCHWRTYSLRFQSLEKKFRLVFRLVCSLTSWAFHVLCECSMQQLWSVVVLCCIGMSWSCMVLLRSSLTILIFGLVSLSITEKILKSPIMVVSLSVFLVL